MKCSQCSGGLEKINRAGYELFYFCRPCQLPHDENGNKLFTTKSLAQAFNPLSHARSLVKKHHPSISSVAKTALEVALLQSIHEAYMAGIKDGVLLAYSQDKQKGVPMEKLGVSQEELKKELQEKYNNLKEKQQNEGLSKEASAGIQSEMDAIKEKLDEMDNN